MNHATLYIGEFTLGLKLAIPFTALILLYANYKVKTIMKG